MKDARWAVVATALYLEQNAHLCTYSEGPQRYFNLNRRWSFPFIGDCSSTVRDEFNWSGALDPYKLGYNVPEGYTGTELAAGNHIPLMIRNGVGALIEEVRPGDAVVYGPGEGWHTALIVKVIGTNVLTVSMGQQGDPSFVWVSKPTCPSLGYGYDGREPQTFLRFGTLTKHVYWPPGFSGGPLPLQTRRAGLRRLSADQEAVARAHGWTVYGWNGSWFRPYDTTIVVSDARWASKRFETKRALARV